MSNAVSQRKWEFFEVPDSDSSSNCCAVKHVGRKPMAQLFVATLAVRLGIFTLALIIMVAAVLWGESRF